MDKADEFSKRIRSNELLYSDYHRKWFTHSGYIYSYNSINSYSYVIHVSRLVLLIWQTSQLAEIRPFIYNFTFCILNEAPTYYTSNISITLLTLTCTFCVLATLRWRWMDTVTLYSSRTCDVINDFLWQLYESINKSKRITACFAKKMRRDFDLKLFMFLLGFNNILCYEI